MSSKPLIVTHLPRADLERRVKDDPQDFQAYALIGWDEGKGALPGKLSNGLWPEWKPKKVLEIKSTLLI
jgi:hypothetical protein